MKVYFASLGCARNQIDSEVMQGRLKRAGMAVTDDPADAAAIVVNTCSFIEAAADESIDAILELAQYKQTGRCRRFIVTGCLPQRYGTEIESALPEVDVFLGTGAFDRIVDAIRVTKSGPACLLPDPDVVVPETIAEHRPNPRGPMAYVKIAEGCNRRCTYCIIPKLRGRQKSRSIDSIWAESMRLVKSGIKELVLVAQESSGYGQELDSRTGLAQLLDRLSGLSQYENNLWIRFLYGHPESIDDALIETVARHANLCAYFDIPIQHISTPVLRNMGRSYTQTDVVHLVQKIRQKIPEAAIRTTFIVGFPGETDEQFDELLHFVADTGFDHLGCFTYSGAQDLPSHRLPNPVPESEAQDRHDRLMKAQRDISSNRNQRYLHRILPVLIEDRLDVDVYAGRTEFQAPEVDGLTIVHSEQDIVGRFVNAQINDTLEYDLVGEAL